MKRPLAYITAPWSNSQYENAENAAAYCRQVYDAGYSPICPVLFLPTFLKDEIPQEHKDGLDMARDYLRRSHALQEGPCQRGNLSECQANLSAKVNTFPASCQGYQASVRIIADSVVFGYSRLVRTNQKP